jgi:hypothetical protein
MLTRRQILAASAAAAALPTVAKTQPQPSLRLRRGMNMWPWFSLTREFPAPSTDYDWPPYQETRAVPTHADLRALRKVGIDFIRLPVDPGPLLAFAGVRRNALVDEVLGAVKMVLAEDLTVILNLHPNGATHFWTPQNLLSSASAPLFLKYCELVATIAARLSRLDRARVAFEPVNEPPQECVSDWPLLQAEIMRKARIAAPNLTLVATGACGSMIAGLEAFDPSTIGDGNIIYTFHFYEPYVFSHQGAPWMSSEPMYRYLNSVPWPSAAGFRDATLAGVTARMDADAAAPAAEKREIKVVIERVLKQYFDAAPDRRFIERHFLRVKAWARKHGIDRGRILLGEFGALRTDERYVAARAADRARYIRDVRETAEALGMPWAYWNYFDGMGLTLDDRSRHFDPPIAAALGLRVADIP